MLKNVFLWSILYLSAYEAAPELLCQVNDNNLPHFAGNITCNTIFENIVLCSVFIIITIIIYKINYNQNLIIKKNIAINPKIIILANFSNSVVICASFLMWLKTGFAFFPNPESRDTLVLLYHDVFGAPFILPILYFSIIISTYIFYCTNIKKYIIISFTAIAFGCYITMSRSLLLSAIMPFLITMDGKKIFKYLPILILVFFMRDILNGSFESYLSSDISDLSLTLISALGEFVNTYFGRRYIIDNNLEIPHFYFLVENIVKGSGLYYILIPFFKTSALFGFNIPSATLELNNTILNSLGLTGFAGTFMSDLVFFPIQSFFLILIYAAIITHVYKKILIPSEKILLILIAAMLLPNAFRWSLMNYISLISGVVISYCFIKRFYLKKLMKNSGSI